MDIEHDVSHPSFPVGRRELIHQMPLLVMTSFCAWEVCDGELVWIGNVTTPWWQFTFAQS